LNTIEGCSKTKREIKTYILAAAIFLISLTLVVACLYNNASPVYPKEWVGISLHALSKNEARMVKESGACWIRIDVFPGFGTAIKNAKEQGLKVLAILDSWIFEQQINFTLEEWKSNVTHYVSQYADNVDAWEIWNEPANPLYPLAAEFYSQMVEIASPIIRQYDPTAKIVLFGGLNLWSGNDPHLELDKDFAQHLTNKGIEQYGDAISIHAYPWSTKIEPTVLQKYNETIAYYRELFTLEFWLTETGYPIDFEGEEGQARYMRDSLDYFGGKVEKFFWYSLVDNAWEDMSFGLFNDDGTPRLAYYELQK
jgi:hypothetical protein